ncbi:hypothetical protein LEP1GSC061_1013 [Leptospira wolffii serovar Khorat str. Khorat-H2]|nr:hypothetical protein LEP1GSC061_1008 [Leptospira wolffii serovar Khorat str. Khorat-H2]EPG65919.1 hypothetical protein LEP1GSC061_2103 [Leptospira wolffii serovar Khorat str. Khorat-H2]EPG66107.1 hypothetical protein LEP1GSC061_2093 [Leptospira wolffii serovar Khorat str. Khorat-H2]EPG66438.1 hypothetical protein LEP1GSC061_1021 [Leptospira wolffii serovar Khorat str. Khorat-H2]EPG68275.1 hypothetical protein LEP1GSC061_1013 [Leptospira wolffii serovar Khorat str. Khorat-H2]
MIFKRPAEAYGSILSNPERGARYFGIREFHTIGLSSK